MAAVLKTVVRQRTGGSNPSASANQRRQWHPRNTCCGDAFLSTGPAVGACSHPQARAAKKGIVGSAATAMPIVVFDLSPPTRDLASRRSPRSAIPPDSQPSPATSGIPWRRLRVLAVLAPLSGGASKISSGVPAPLECIECRNAWQAPALFSSRLRLTGEPAPFTPGTCPARVWCLRQKAGKPFA